MHSYSQPAIAVTLKINDFDTYCATSVHENDDDDDDDDDDDADYDLLSRLYIARCILC